MKIIKCFILGDDTVGKSSLLVTFCSGWFPKDYIPFSINNYSKNLIYNQHPIKLEIFDTNGDDAYDEVRRVSCTNVDVFIICFSLVDQNTLSHVESKWVREIQDSNQNVPYVLVGLKKDLRNSQSISSELGEEVKSRIHAYSYVECSSLNLDNVNLVFKTALDSIHPNTEPEARPQQHPQQPQQSQYQSQHQSQYQSQPEPQTELKNVTELKSPPSILRRMENLRRKIKCILL